MQAAFGDGLREWRTRRRLSQLDLALSANVSARHISFLETGRSRPSRGMVLRLCDLLDVPRPDRNRLLTSAGLSPAYAARDRSAEDMAPVQAAVDWILDRHAPYPAFALDRHWTLQTLNVPARRLFPALGLGEGANLITALTHDAALRGAIENLDEVEAALAARLRTESVHLGGDPVLDAAIATLTRAPRPAADPAILRPAFIPTRLRLGDRQVALMSTVAQFGATDDIALSELKIEMMFPADAATRDWLMALGAGAGS